MSRYDYSDIMMELMELCRELKSDIMQQLNYYRASVYKTETAKVIERKIEQMRIVADLIGDELLTDAFHDYEEMKKNSSLLVAPGECVLSMRVMNLLQVCEKICEQLTLERQSRQGGDRQQFARNVQRHRRELLSMCRQGTRQWAFFNAL
jgi:hypothetical protein